MDDRLNIPKTIRVGFQNRDDTYTGKLAYVVYIDAKGKLRKEQSWESWRDKKIAPVDYPNEPTSGFVLNRDVGGTQRSWSWNARREKVRVYDPRNFEFEISVENLLFILQECSAIKGKGLEGEFVYGWGGSEIVLVPVTSQEYTKSVNFCALQVKKVGAKEMVEGCTYKNKDEKEVMYLGRYTWFDEYKGYSSYYWGSNRVFGKKKHVFVYLDENIKGRERYWLQSGFDRIAERTSDKAIPQFADEFDKLKSSRYVAKPVELILEDSTAKIADTDRWYGANCICIPKAGKIYLGRVGRDWYNSRNKDQSRPFEIECDSVVTLQDGEIKNVEERRGIDMKRLSLEEVKALIKDLYVKCENGAKYKVRDE